MGTSSQFWFGRQTPSLLLRFSLKLSFSLKRRVRAGSDNHESLVIGLGFWELSVSSSLTSLVIIHLWLASTPCIFSCLPFLTPTWSQQMSPSLPAPGPAGDFFVLKEFFLLTVSKVLALWEVIWFLGFLYFLSIIVRSFNIKRLEASVVMWLYINTTKLKILVMRNE